MRVDFGRLAAPTGDLLDVEVVERKGLGHPDTICDALSEALSVAICRRSLQLFGRVLHHNVDKSLLWGGAAAPAFGGGKILEPIEIYLAGRATTTAGGNDIDIDDLTQEVCRTWFRSNLPTVDPSRHLKVHSLVRRGSIDLTHLFDRSSHEVALANDTSCGVGFAPLSWLELLVLRIEKMLSSIETSKAHPEIGADIKVMGLRRGSDVRLVVACALVGRHVASIEDYVQKKEDIADLIRSNFPVPISKNVEIVVNAADDIKRGKVYLTVSGTSAESGDDGQSGRGNRVNGLITPFRSMTIESVAGKNPINHVGKLYNVAASLIAQKIVETVPGVAEAQCVLVSKIGMRIDLPEVIQVRVRPSMGKVTDRMRRSSEEIVQTELADISTLVRQFLIGSLRLDRWPLRGNRTPA